MKQLTYILACIFLISGCVSKTENSNFQLVQTTDRLANFWQFVDGNTLTYQYAGNSVLAKTESGDIIVEYHDKNFPSKVKVVGDGFYFCDAKGLNVFSSGDDSPILIKEFANRYADIYSDHQVLIKNLDSIYIYDFEKKEFLSSFLLDSVKSVEDFDANNGLLLCRGASGPSISLYDLNARTFLLDTFYVALDSMTPLTERDFPREKVILEESILIWFGRSNKVLLYDHAGKLNSNFQYTTSTEQFHSTLQYPVCHQEDNRIIFHQHGNRNGTGKLVAVDLEGVLQWEVDSLADYCNVFFEKDFAVAVRYEDGKQLVTKVDYDSGNVISNTVIPPKTIWLASELFVFGDSILMRERNEIWKAKLN